MTILSKSSVKQKSFAKRSPYLGVTRDGVKILRPTGPVDNITLAQARKAVAEALKTIKGQASKS